MTDPSSAQLGTTDSEFDLRFVVLRHTFPAGHNRANHWDLMLEFNGKLITWALEELPAPGKNVAAKPLPDHRLGYLELEGPISGDRGSVSRVLNGRYRFVSDAKDAAILWLESETWRMRIQTEKEKTWIGFEAV